MEVRKAIERLVPLISSCKRAKIASVVSSRTNYITVLLDNCRDLSNESAIARSMESLGSYQLHRLTSNTFPIVTVRPRKLPRSDAGARKWIFLHQWVDTQQCVTFLKENGYSVAVASGNAKLSIKDLDFNRKTVVVFGNEVNGVSNELRQHADVQFSLPMCGFVESFNVSVAAAITLYHAYLHRISTNVSDLVPLA